MSNKLPNWFNDEEFETSNIVIFKNETIHFLKFLNEGKKSSSKIQIGETKEGIPKYKTVPCVEFSVMEDDIEKMYNPISKQVINDLQELYPLSERIFRIELQRGRTDVENKYLITEMK